jgi:hypothetical protein
MTKWYDIFLYLFAGSLLVSTLCVSIIGCRKVGLFGEHLSGWFEEFNPVDLKILKFAGYTLLTGLLSLVVYVLLYI